MHYDSKGSLARCFASSEFRGGWPFGPANLVQYLPGGGWVQEKLQNDEKDEWMKMEKVEVTERMLRPEIAIRVLGKDQTCPMELAIHLVL